ncbi:MAG: hypothetical protein WD032_06995 [Nitrospirales bacterium]
MAYEKYSLTLLEFVNRYPNFYADISPLILPNRLGMLLNLRHHPEIFERLIFGIDYLLSVFHLPMRGCTSLSAIRHKMRTANRFDLQHPVC